MSSTEVALETSPRRSLRRTTSELKQSASDQSVQKTTIGKRRPTDDEDAPILDCSEDVKIETISSDTDDDDSGGPPPLKKVARTSAGGGSIMWKTATGAPKQLAFKKVGTGTGNGAISKATTTNGSAAPPAPLNLATALAGLLPSPSSPSPITTVLPRKIILKPQQRLMPTNPITTQPSHSIPIPPSSSSSLPSSSTAPITRKKGVGKVENEICDGCVRAMPVLRRSLGRLESRMEAVTMMIKQIVQKHSQAAIVTRPMPVLTQQRLVPTVSTGSASPSSINGGRREVTGKPTAMRFVPVSARLAGGGTGGRKFISDKTSRLTPGTMMYRMISRGLLTYRSPIMTTEEYYKGAPAVIKQAHTLPQVQAVMGDLVNSGLYKKTDPMVDTLDPECIFEKETNPTKLAKLVCYDVSPAEFLSGCDE